jgi:hypothetical protein
MQDWMARAHKNWGVPPGTVTTEEELGQLLDARARVHRAVDERRHRHEERETRRLRTLAKQFGYEGRAGGWIYLLSGDRCLAASRKRDANGMAITIAANERPVCQGWRSFESRFGQAVGFKRRPFLPCTTHDDCRQLPELGRACVYREHGLTLPSWPKATKATT